MKKKLPTIGFALLFCGLAACNLLLVRQNLQLRRALDSYRPSGLAAGQSVPSFTATGLDGATFNVGYDGTGPKKVLFFFTPTCRYCHGQFAYWRELMDRADRSRFEIIGVVSGTEDPAKIKEYLREVSGDSRTPLRVAMMPADALRSYKLSATPITVVVGNDGKVEQTWPGLWQDSEIAKASSVFGFSFSPRLPNKM